jgi:hypothetical protein
MCIGLSSDDIDDWPPDGVDFLLGMNLLGSCKVERVREERMVQFVVGAEAGEVFDIGIHRRTWNTAPLSPMKEAPGGSTLLRRVRFGYVNEAGTAIAFVPGRVGDLYLMRGGFWQLEFFDGHRPGFWTKGRARLWLPLAPPQRDAVLTMAISTRQRHPEAAAADLQVICNGHPIAMTTQSEDAETGVRIEQGAVPKAWLTVSNDVEIACAPWRPHDYGSADPRELGIVVHRVAIETKLSEAGAP